MYMYMEWYVLNFCGQLTQSLTWSLSILACTQVFSPSKIQGKSGEHGLGLRPHQRIGTPPFPHQREISIEGLKCAGTTLYMMYV